MGAMYWLASYPKSGNTWLRAWLGNLRLENDVPADINALNTPIASSRGWLDMVLGFDTADLDSNEIDHLRRAVYDWEPASDRISYHKVHDAYLRSSSGPPMFGTVRSSGAVYVVRNPLDVALSYSAHSGRSVDRAIELMADPAHAHNAHRDRMAMQVRQVYLDWSGHVRSWADAPDLPVHVVRYEDMHAAPHNTLRDVARFLRLPDDPRLISRAVDNSSFARLSAQERAGGFAERPPTMTTFFREGRSGGWRGKLRDGQIERVISDHGAMMKRFGYLDADGTPV